MRDIAKCKILSADIEAVHFDLRSSRNNKFGRDKNNRSCKLCAVLIQMVLGID